MMGCKSCVSIAILLSTINHICMEKLSRPTSDSTGTFYDIRAHCWAHTQNSFWIALNGRLCATSLLSVDGTGSIRLNIVRQQQHLLGRNCPYKLFFTLVVGQHLSLEIAITTTVIEHRLLIHRGRLHCVTYLEEMVFPVTTVLVIKLYQMMSLNVTNFPLGESLKITTTYCLLKYVICTIWKDIVWSLWAQVCCDKFQRSSIYKIKIKCKLTFESLLHWWKVLWAVLNVYLEFVVQSPSGFLSVLHLNVVLSKSSCLTLCNMSMSHSFKICGTLSPTPW